MTKIEMTRIHDERVAAVKDYIGRHYQEELRLEQLAAIVSMAPTSLSHFFRQRTGQSINDYIIDVRMREVEQALTSGEDPVSDICFRCGFNTLTNFNRQFKKRNGCTPTQYRERRRAQHLYNNIYY